MEIDIPIPTGTDLILNYIAPDSVSATLLAPNGTVVGTTLAGTPDAAQFLRFFSIPTPIEGTYKLRLEQQGGTTGNVPIAAVISGNPLLLNLDVGQPDSNNQAQINAILTNAGSPVTGATVLANIQGIDGYQKVLTLLDDGQNGDGIAGDGIYGGKTELLSPDGYNIGVVAQGSNFSRIASDAISIARPNQANLSLRQVELLDSGIVEQDITYTFEVNNIGPNEATGVILVNSLPQGVDFVSASAGGSFNPANRTVSFNLGDLAFDGSTTANIVVKRKVSGGLRSIATVTATELDPDLTNNTVETKGIDLLLKRTTNQPRVDIGEEYTYSLSVTNNGPDNATEVVLTENLPSGANFVRSSTAPVSLFGETLTANLGNIKSGDSATINLTFKSIVAGNLLSTISVAGNEDDYNTENNSLISTTTINPILPAQADLELTKTVNNTNPQIGDRISFTLDLTNKGPGIASGIKVSDLLSTGLNFVSAFAEQGTYNNSTGIWDVGNVRDNLSRSLTITADIVSGGTITNTAEIISVNETDPDSTPGNNNPNEDDQDTVILVVPGNNNIVNGTPGRDTLVGSSGNNIITGFQGADTLSGGTGSDDFVYTNIRDRGDTVNNFEVGKDKLVFTELLSNLPSYTSSSNVNNYLQILQIGGSPDSFSVRVDADGSGADIFRPFITVKTTGGTLSLNDFRYQSTTTVV
ncbi:choice-of-anchor X domain-containing protein [Scytonema sp. NUACC26]|uniref:choice-of-anchor X domain-containing protein n=1 Tax=Scytonema sp. NUACC26 TaxID=3140176 RepID=UPI0034DBA77E